MPEKKWDRESEKRKGGERASKFIFIFAMNEIIDSVWVGEQETRIHSQSSERCCEVWQRCKLRIPKEKRAKKILVTEHTHTDTHSGDSACPGVLSVPHATHWPGTFLPHPSPYPPSISLLSSPPSCWLPAALLVRCCHIILSEMLSKCALPAAAPKGQRGRKQGRQAQSMAEEWGRQRRRQTDDGGNTRRSRNTSRKSWKWK